MEGSPGQIQGVGLGCEGPVHICPKMSSGACNNPWCVSHVDNDVPVYSALQFAVGFLDVLTLAGKQDSAPKLPSS